MSPGPGTSQEPFPHTGWVEPQTAATLPPPQDSQEPSPGGYSISEPSPGGYSVSVGDNRGLWRDGSGVQSCPGRGPRTAWGEDPCTGSGGGGDRKPGMWPRQERCNSPVPVLKERSPAPRPRPAGWPAGAAESGARAGRADVRGHSRASLSREAEVKRQRLRGCGGGGRLAGLAARAPPGPPSPCTGRASPRPLRRPPLAAG